MPSKPIFISHAVADKEIADIVVDLLNTGMGINPSDSIFCSSLEGLGIPGGADFKGFIHTQIQDPKVVLLLISQNYVASQFCLAEAGASWAFSHQMVPFIVPPLTFKDMEAVLKGTQALKIEEKDDWNAALGQLKGILGIDPDVARWEKKRDEHLERLKVALEKQPDPPTVVLSKFKEATTLLAEKTEALEDAGNLLKTSEALIEKLKQLKDQEEVEEAVFDELPFNEQFEQLVAASKAKLGELPSIVGEALFFDCRSESMPGADFGQDFRRDDIRDALHRGMLDEREGLYDANSDHPLVAEASKELAALRELMRQVPTEFKKLYEGRHKHPFVLTNRDFWSKNLL
jgi:hypothetical protein